MPKNLLINLKRPQIESRMLDLLMFEDFIKGIMGILKGHWKN